MEKTKKNSFDGILFATVVILSLVGLVMIFSASAPSAFSYYNDSFYFVKKQLLCRFLDSKTTMYLKRKNSIKNIVVFYVFFQLENRLFSTKSTIRRYDYNTFTFLYHRQNCANFYSSLIHT